MIEIETPFDRYRGRVKPEWVDYNNHFNMGYYLVAFDLASEELSDAAGFTAETRAATGVTIYVLETHVIYRREVKPDESFRITTQLLGADRKRLHLWQALYTDGNPDPAAFNETMMLCVSQKNPKATPWPEAVHQAFQAIAKAHAALPYPADAGRCVRRIGVAD
jgi:acyl-CoA thioester hydrolase